MKDDRHKVSYVNLKEFQNYNNNIYRKSSKNKSFVSLNPANRKSIHIKDFSFHSLPSKVFPNRINYLEKEAIIFKKNA